MARSLELKFDIEGNFDEIKNEFEALVDEAEKFVKTVEDPIEIKVDVKDALDNLGKLNKEFGKTANEGKKAGSNILKSFGELTSGIKGLGPVGAAVGAGLGIVTSVIGGIVNSTKELVNNLQETSDQLYRVGVAFSGNIRKEDEQRLTAIVQSTALLTELDFDTTLKGFTAMMKTLGGTAQQTGVYFATLKQLTGEAFDDTVSWITEYSALLRKFSFNAKDAFNISVNLFRSGTFDDKLFDSIKEFSLKIGDLSTAEEKILRDANLFKYIEQVRKGTITGGEALNIFATEIEKIQKKGQDITPIGKALFGSAGEDLGVLVPKLKDVTKLNGDLAARVNFLNLANKELLVSQQAVSAEFNKFTAGPGREILTFTKALKILWNNLKTTFIATVNFLGKDITRVFRNLSKTLGVFTEDTKKSSSMLRQFMGAFIYIGRVVLGFIARITEGAKATRGFSGVVEYAMVKTIEWGAATWNTVATIINAISSLLNFMIQAGNVVSRFFNLFSVLPYEGDTKLIGKLGKISQADIDAQKKAISQAMKDAASFTPQTGDVSAGGGAEAGGFQSGAGGGGGESAENAAKKQLEEDKKKLDAELNLVKLSFEEKRRLNDHNLALEKIDKEKHAENLRKIDEEEFKYLNTLYREFYTKRVGLNEETVDKLINDDAAYVAHFKSLQGDAFDTQKEFIDALRDAKEKEIASIRKLEEEKLQIEKERIEKVKLAEMERTRDYFKMKQAERDFALDIAKKETEDKYELFQLEQQAIAENLRAIEEEHQQLISIANITAEERQQIDEEYAASRLALEKELTRSGIEQMREANKDMKEFTSKAFEGLAETNPILKESYALVKKIQDEFKKIDDLISQGKLGDLEGKIAKGLIVAQAATQIFSQISSTISEGIVAGLDDEIKKQDKVIENLKSQIEAEKQSNSEANTRQEIINELAKNRIEELETLKSTIPEAEKEAANAAIELERSRIVDVEAMRVQQANSQAARIRQEEQIRANLERRKVQAQSRAFEIQRAANIAETIMKGAIAVVAAWASNPLTAPLLTAIIGTATGVGVATIASQKNPHRFNKGTLFVPGEDGIDRVPALLTRGEAVLPKDINIDYHPIIEAIYHRKISPQVANSIGSGDVTNVVLAVDEKGFSTFVESSAGRTEYVNKKLRYNKV